MLVKTFYFLLLPRDALLTPPRRDLTAWRHHCQTKHAALPGYGPQRISTGRGRKLEMFSAAAGRFQCPRCKRRFPTQEEMEDHRHR